MNCKYLIIIIFAIGLPTKSVAKQLGFSRIEQEDSYQFYYQWLDHSQEQQQLSFLLEKSTLFEKFRSFRSYIPKLANNYIQRKVRNKLLASPLPGVQTQFYKKDGNINIKISSRDVNKVTQAKATIAELEAEYFDQYLMENHYQRFIDHHGNVGIKPNHTDIANQSVASLKSLKAIILEQVEVKNIRKVTSYVTSFIQSIPYSPLESRITSSGAGFATPLNLLFENKGDCDSKSVLAGALLRAIMPRVKLIMVFIDGHALIGVDAPISAGDITIRHDHTTYILLEPTGPAILPLGTISLESEQAIDNGLYTVEEFK